MGTTQDAPEKKVKKGPANKPMKNTKKNNKLSQVREVSRQNNEHELSELMKKMEDNKTLQRWKPILEAFYWGTEYPLRKTFHGVEDRLEKLTMEFKAIRRKIADTDK